MTITQEQKAAQFKALHQSGCFIIPNPWDAGSARLLAGMGYLALATSSGAAAGVLGRKDGEISRDESIAHARIIVAATDLPVAADLENGFGDTPADAALTIRRAAEVGLVGGSIEDASGINAATGERRIYDFNHAVERVTAAAEVAHAQPFAFTFTARCENFLRGNPDIDDTIRRLQAYEKSRCRCVVCSRTAQHRSSAPGVPIALQTVQLHGRHQGQVVQRGRARSRRRAPH